MVDIVDKALRMGEGHQLKKLENVAKAVNALEDEISALSDEDLKAQTPKFKQEIENGKSLDEIMPEAFATVREVSKRTLGQRHFDVQLMGGAALHWGNIAEMKTGEGKTLVATLPTYLNALEGKGVHVVTVNDYLASYQSELMGRIYRFLGMNVGCIITEQKPPERRKQYNADITYGTNNEFGFDYLRDNMVYDSRERVQRPLNYAIVDEVDSILIDEARTPLIISGQSEDQTDLYEAMNRVAPMLTRQEGEEDPITGKGVTKPGDFTVDEKAHQVYLTEQGHIHAEQILNKLGILPEGASLYDPANIALMHHLYAALRAYNLYHRDQHYVVQQGEKGMEIVIVDEFTGRLMAGRRWSDGLHQAVEAKEGVPIQAENLTMATITFQNYFRLYKKLSGMTGTADTEAFEFQEIYALETVVIPPNRPSRRTDQLDRVYKTTPEKYKAAIEDIRECHERGQPVLVGTTSIENSEIISELLQKANLPHQVLNAKQHAREADIIVQAGRPGMITIATNMAGRGTDIMLGGNLEKMVASVQADETLDEAEKAQRIQNMRDNWKADHDKVSELGGLRIIATERHESRRIDNQLRGRSGRQGDPGSSRFYLSLDDQLMRIFAGDRVRAIMDRLKMPEGEAIEAGMVSRSIESAQRKVEARNFDIRKQLLEFDNVANEQRKVIYHQRNEVLESVGLQEQIDGMRESCFTDLVHAYVPEQSMEEQWDLPALEKILAQDWGVHVDLLAAVQASDSITAEDILDAVIKQAHATFQAKLDLVDQEQFLNFERAVLLQSMDTHWREHLSALDYLRQGIHLRSYAQRQPKEEYKREAFELFGQMLDAIKNDVTRILMSVRVESPEQLHEAANELEEKASEGYVNITYTAPNESGEAEQTLAHTETTEDLPEEAFYGVGRNDPCPCGSGQRYKHCHGQLS